MVRREGRAEEDAEATAEAEPCCIVPAGESPARVIAGEPGSRPALEAQKPTGEAWCQKPDAVKAVGGKQQRGPQHEVKPAASSESQSESRAAHVTAKATSLDRESGWSGGLGGVGEQHALKERCGTRETRLADPRRVMAAQISRRRKCVVVSGNPRGS